MLRTCLAVALLSFAALSGCIEADNDEPGGASDYVEPMYADLADVPATISGMKLLGGSEVPTGSGIWVDGDYAYVGALSQGFFVVNIANPAAPAIVGSVPGLDAEGIYGRDVDLLKYDDGRKVAVVAGQGAGLFFIDVTDPTMPDVISVVTNDMIDGLPSHNVDVIPGTTFLFNAPSGGLGGTNHLINASNPETPAIVKGIGQHGCHDITFYMSDAEAKYRAYCAGRDITEIWDLSDLSDIKILTQMNHPVVDNGGGLHHLAMVNQDATLLIIGDEFQGGGGPGCQINTPVASTPVGALWFFDITGEKELDPEQVGWFSATVPASRYTEQILESPGAQPATSCTSHFGSFIADTDVFAIAWYYAGVILLDLSDPSMPQQIAQYNTDTVTWDVKFHRGVLVTGDMTTGLEVFELI